MPRVTGRARVTAPGCPPASKPEGRAKPPVCRRGDSFGEAPPHPVDPGTRMGRPLLGRRIALPVRKPSGRAEPPVCRRGDSFGEAPPHPEDPCTRMGRPLLGRRNACPLREPSGRAEPPVCRRGDSFGEAPPHPEDPYTRMGRPLLGRRAAGVGTPVRFGSRAEEQSRPSAVGATHSGRRHRIPWTHVPEWVALWAVH